MLSSEIAAEPGKWVTARAEYQRGIMDAFNDPSVEKIVVMKAAQVGWTELINNAAGFYIDKDPGPILVIQPTIEAAEMWSKDRFSPMVRDTKVLSEKVSGHVSRDSSNTLRQKSFPGGRLAIVGANAPSGLAARPIRVVLADEVDRYPASAGTEGDPLNLARKRQTTFWNRKTLIGSTPLHKETSIVYREYLSSDQRVYLVPCPHCSFLQTLKWSQVRWDKDENGKHLHETAHYVCEDCGSIWNDVDRWDAVRTAHDHGGGWKATKPFNGTAGFHIIGMLSSWVTLSSMVDEFLKAKNDIELLQVWTNTTLGEVFEEAGEKLDPDSLLNRGENYDLNTVPREVQLVTAGVDVQGDRLEIQTIGWGAGEESWVLSYDVLFGDPAQAAIWEELDRLLLSRLRFEKTGGELKINAVCIDSGGHHANQVLTFAMARHRRRVFACKGAAGIRPLWPKRASQTKDHRLVYLLGVDTGKDAIYGRLRIRKPGPGYIHFPADQTFNKEYFDQLTSETVMTRKRMGRPYRLWVLPPGRRNEALDTAVLAMAARQSIPLRLDSDPLPSDIPPPSEETDDDVIDMEADTEIGKTPAVIRKPYRQQTNKEPWMGNRSRGWFERD